MMNKAVSIIQRVRENPRMVVSYLCATGLLNFLSDKSMLSLLWWSKTGKKLNLQNPATYNEKIQWLKINNRKAEMTMMVDKYKVREFVAGIIGEEHLIPLVGVWNTPEDIDFDQLPQQFVLKCNHNAAVGLCICRDKNKLDKAHAMRELKRGLKKNFYYNSREWAYKNVSRKVICEQYMEDRTTTNLRDYKFFCFNGKAEFIYISEGLENHDTAKISFYDLFGHELPFHRSDYQPFIEPPAMPDNMDEMIEAADKIAKNVPAPFVRVDLYSINGKMYFSEITFYPNSGFIPFEPEEWDEKIGEMIHLPI